MCLSRVNGQGPKGTKGELRSSLLQARSVSTQHGRDFGFEMFKKDEVKMITDHENSIWLIDLIKQFFKRTSIDYQVVPRNELRRQQRLKLFNTESDN